MESSNGNALFCKKTNIEYHHILIKKINKVFFFRVNNWNRNTVFNQLRSLKNATLP